MGVTQVLINLAITFSERVSVLYFTSSYLQSGIINRITSSLSQIPMEKFARNDLTCEDIAKILTLHFTNAFNKIHLHDSDGDSIDTLKALRQMLIEGRKLEVIIIDNLQDTCHSKLEGKFIKELKSIAEDFRVTVILATDIFKKVATRNDKRPKLKDLPKSNLIQELCDKIIFVHRQERSCNRVELIIAKNANGNTGCVTLARDESLTNIIDRVRVS